VILDPRVNIYTGKMADTGMADKVSAAEGAKQRALSVSHDLFVGDADLKNIHNYRQTFYNWIMRISYDWAGSLRLLPAYRLPKTMQEFQEHKNNFDKLVQKFVDDLPAKIANASFARGAMFHIEDYPSADQLQGRFNMELHVMEVPEGDFRVQVSQDLADDLKANFERQAENYIAQVQKDQVSELVKLMKSISHCCELETIVQPDGTTKVKRRRLYDSTIEQAIECCDKISKFNIVQDQALEDARIALAGVLSGVNVDALRESETMRADMKNEVDQILAKF
jgi:hypothetical protein